ncbi:MAG: hypothetical protein HY658_10750, partial [Actinobacteria bacterium]|nr:hypothetical protein [Actinomycetota bacterium]
VMLRPRLVLSAVPLVMLAVAGSSLAATRIPPVSPRVPVVMLTGDSVPLRLQVAFEEEAESRGWRVVSAARGACSVSGEQAVARSGRMLHVGSNCPTAIPRLQSELIRTADPDVVIWWDRWSISDFLTEEGKHVRSGTPRFWRLRRAALRDTLERLTAGGARVLLVGTEPPGSAVLERNWTEAWWVQFQIDAYDDVTSRWNDLLRGYAEGHPDVTAFLSLTGAICHVDEPLCDDTIEGVPARPDGIHYEGAGATRVTDLLAGAIAPLMGHR